LMDLFCKQEPGDRFDPPYSAGAAARWLPRALAAAVLLASLLAAERFDLPRELNFTRPLRYSLMLVGGLLSLWFVRTGGELRVRISLGDRGIRFAHGTSATFLGYDEIHRLSYAVPFAHRRQWIPAVVLIDESGRGWRLPALLTRGDQLLDDLIRKSDREDLLAWADSLGLMRRLGRAPILTAIGYLMAVGLICAAALFYAGAV